ncbi:MAG: inositol monophosphatase [Oligoflexia bacterium]|nr:inositol monophosphatase [Oligoflexia bacterium]
MKTLEHYREIAIKAAHIGGKILNCYFKKDIDFDVKEEFGNAAGLVTEADKKSEEAICDFLLSKTKDFSILAEESGLAGDGKNRWIIDPLDGTTNFYHKFPQFCISIGLEIDGDIHAGVIYNPSNNYTYHAIKEGGAFINDQRIFVSNTKDLQSAMLGTGFAYMRDELLDKAVNLFKKFTGICHGIRRPGSAALDLCNLACGIYDGFYEETLKPWDVAAGSLIITEAGGMVSDFNGGPFTVYSEQIVATNGLLHGEILNVLQSR